MSWRFMKKMKLQKYKTGSGNICITSCLRDMLNYFGFEVREYMIFVVSMANMFYYEDFFQNFVFLCSPGWT